MSSSLILDILSAKAIESDDIELLFTIEELTKNAKEQLEVILGNINDVVRHINVDFSNLKIKQQYVGYSKVDRDASFEYTDEDIKKCNLNPENLLHKALFNVYLVQKFQRGCVSYRYNEHADGFLIDTKGIIRILPSRDTGYISIKHSDCQEMMILRHIEKKMKFDSFDLSRVSVFGRRNKVMNETALLRLMTSLMSQWKTLTVTLTED